MNNKYKLKRFGLLFLILSVIIIIPLNFGSIYADMSGTGSSMTEDTSREDATNTCSIIPPVDVKSSLFLSAVMLCIPGILEKTWEWKQLKCTEMACHYESVKAGIDPAYCSKEASYKFCKEIAGEIFAIPPMSILEYLKDLIANILANPVGMVYGVAAKMARSYATECMSAGGCNSWIMGATMLFLGFTDITAAAQTFKDIKENGFFPNFDLDNKCENLEKIKEEMEEIIDAMEEGEK